MRRAMTRWMTQDRWTALTCLIIGIVVALAIPSQTSDRPIPGARGFDILDGAFFPKIAVTLFIVAAIWLFFEAQPRPGDGDRAGASVAKGEDEPPGITLRDFLLSLVLVGGVLVYVQLLDVVGYVICTIVGVCLLAAAGGQRSLRGFLLGGVAFPVAIYFLFTELFFVPLPRGLL